MKRLFVNPRWALLFVLALISLGVSGCATADSDNASVRPWNAPNSWDTGLPSTLTEGR